MSGRWQYKVVEVPVKLFGGGITERMQAELDKLGSQGWDLVSTVQAATMDVVRLVLKRPA